MIGIRWAAMCTSRPPWDGSTRHLAVNRWRSVKLLVVESRIGLPPRRAPAGDWTGILSRHSLDCQRTSALSASLHCMTTRCMPGSSPLERVRRWKCCTATTRSPHHSTMHRTGQPVTTASPATTAAAHEATDAASVILAPHRPLRTQPDLNPGEWKEMATCKIDEARAKFDATARRSKKKGRQPSSPVPQLWSEDELEEQFVRGSGAGGQKINKTSCCVLVTVR
jgi:hypothetical protein